MTENNKLTPEEMAANKAEFLALISTVNRPGMPELIDWLENRSDFFTAPSSSKYHGAYEGGLCQHSLNVYKAFKMLHAQALNMAIPNKLKDLQDVPEETIIVTTLLHDLCKTNFYVRDYRNWKDETDGQWKRYYTYKSDDLLPLGHGEKSVIMIQNFTRLSMLEAIMIRWHMGMFDVGIQMSSFERPSFMIAANNIPLLNIMCLADYYATFLMEVCGDPKKDNAI